ncbi:MULTISPECIES: MarR family winged helix-turn-helix transcriptional regulator [unclassified Streptomyces]|uniref:MarR family winged helix-turn-helix transcriptional regulator n=1 Tax=unclassified Streptomyces TaxID=2593676 RepID=UPI002E298359|nr:MarR family transcriptional regulator [Streptomyces sp. NBC_01429]
MHGSSDRTGRGIAELQALLSALAYDLTRPRTHERIVAMAGMPVDRAGLALLRVLVEEGQPLRIGRIAERLGVRTPHVTRQVRELERQGLVERVLEPADRRARRITPTPLGSDTLARVDRASQASLAESLDGVAAHRIEDAVEVLRRISSHRRTGGSGTGGAPAPASPPAPAPAPEPAPGSAPAPPAAPAPGSEGAAEGGP